MFPSFCKGFYEHSRGIYNNIKASVTLSWPFKHCPPCASTLIAYTSNVTDSDTFTAWTSPISLGTGIVKNSYGSATLLCKCFHGLYEHNRHFDGPKKHCNGQ